MSDGIELPLRTVLFAPGHEPRTVEKVASFGADAVILDLEDAVPDADKVATRPLVRAVLAEIRGCMVCVRVNGFHTELTAGDVAGVVGPGLTHDPHWAAGRDARGRV